MHSIVQGETKALTNMKRWRRCGCSDLVLDLSSDWRRLRSSRDKATSGRLRRAAGLMVVETNVVTVLLICAAIAVVPIAGVIIVVAEVVVSLTGSLVCVRAIAARPVPDPDLTG